jgi:putative DNA primase/helicase
MSAVVSNGGAWPYGEGSTILGDVIFMSAEDGIRDTIIPRLIAAGANTARVHIVASAIKPDGTGRKTFSLKTDVDLLEAKAKEIGCVRLIIVDPISAYMGGSDGNGNVETREVLEPLAEMADRLRIAVVAVTHLNKGGAGGQSALNRFAGSIWRRPEPRLPSLRIRKMTNGGCCSRQKITSGQSARVSPSGWSSA